MYISVYTRDFWLEMNAVNDLMFCSQGHKTFLSFTASSMSSLFLSDGYITGLRSGIIIFW